MGDQTHLRCFCHKGERENEKQAVSDHEPIITAEFVIFLNIVWGFCQRCGRNPYSRAIPRETMGKVTRQAMVVIITAHTA